MKDSGFIVDNPFELNQLFENGVFLLDEPKQTRYKYFGKGDKHILNVFIADEPNQDFGAYEEMISKIMGAVTINGVRLTRKGFATVNINAASPDMTVADVIDDFKPEKLILWSDSWAEQGNEVLYYKTGKVRDIEILRCHALKTVVADDERKRACWTAIKAYFNM